MVKDYRRFLEYFTYAGLVVALTCYSVDLYRNGSSKQYVAWFSGGAFVLLCFPVSMREIYFHLSNWHMPQVQRYVVRILWMVPIYALESWLSLRFRDFSLYLRAFRESYEAYVIFCFLYYLIALIGDEQVLSNILRNKSQELGSHPWPFNCCFKRWQMGRAFLNHCKLGVLQYVVLKNVVTVLTVVLEWRGWYNEGNFSFQYGYVYLTALANFSQTWALYALVKFYYAAYQELEMFRPVGKFACVKAVVFLTWWQSVTISMLQAWGLIYDISEEWTKDDIGQGLQDWLICVEMLVAALAHQRAFTYKDYMGVSSHEGSSSGLPDAALYRAFLLSTLPRDLFSDLKRIALGGMRRSGSRHESGRAVSDTISAMGTPVRGGNTTESLLLEGGGGSIGVIITQSPDRKGNKEKI